MTGTLRNKPAKCCCCECWDDVNFTNWVDGGKLFTGTTTRATSSANAVLASDRRATFQVLTAWCLLSSHIAGDAVRFGFRNDSGDQVYMEAVVQSPNTDYVIWSAYEHPINESRTLLWAGPLVNVSHAPSVRLLYDEYYEDFYYGGGTGNRFTWWNTQTRGVDQKLTTSLAVNTAFVGTVNFDAGSVATFTLSDHYNCLCRYCMGIGAAAGERGGIHFGPPEFELEIAGVTGSAAATINVASVTVYEPYPAPPPFAGGAFAEWFCYWGWRNPDSPPFTLYANSIDIAYSDATDETTISVRCSNLYGGGEFLRWSRVVSGRLDARTIDVDLDSSDLVYDPDSIAGSATVSLRASP